LVKEPVCRENVRVVSVIRALLENRATNLNILDSKLHCEVLVCGYCPKVLRTQELPPQIQRQWQMRKKHISYLGGRKPVGRDDITHGYLGATAGLDLRAVVER
jgi:hypothetical protein